MRSASRQILRRDPNGLLPKFSFAFAHSHARTLREDEQISREKYRSNFYHGLLVADRCRTNKSFSLIPPPFTEIRLTAASLERQEKI
jgi:hypothetical protein